MNTPALSADNSPVTSFCSMVSPPAQYFSASPSQCTDNPSPLVLSRELIERAAFDVVDILTIHCKHMGGAYNTQLVSESAWVAAMAIKCDKEMQIGYYYEIQQQVKLLPALPLSTTCHQIDTPHTLLLHEEQYSIPPQPEHLQNNIHTTTIREQRVVCPDCLRSFSRSDSLIRHRRKSCTYPKNVGKSKKPSRHIKNVFSIRPY